MFLIPITYYVIIEIEEKNIRSGQKQKKKKKTYTFFGILFHFGSDKTNFNVFLRINWANLFSCKCAKCEM